MDKATKHRKLMTLLSKAGVNDQTRHDLVHGWTEGRTQSTKKLTAKELDDLLWKLQHDSFFNSNIKRSANAMQELALKEKRSTVLAIAQRVGLHEGTSFEKFNRFMKNKSIYKKKLSAYTFDELQELIKQMHTIERNYNKSAEKAGTKAWHDHFGIPQGSDN